jgi:hypothetical protein
MKLPFPESRQEFLDSFVVSVFFDHIRSEIAVYLHEKGIEGEYIRKQEFSKQPEGILEEQSARSVRHQEMFRPSNVQELKDELDRRIRKFARQNGVLSEGIYFETLDIAMNPIRRLWKF